MQKSPLYVCIVFGGYYMDKRWKSSSFWNGTSYPYEMYSGSELQQFLLKISFNNYYTSMKNVKTIVKKQHLTSMKNS